VRSSSADTPDADVEGEVRPDALAWMNDVFAEYVEGRRTQPRHDVLTALATGTFPDGTLPEVIDVVRVAAFLFAAGGETTARLLSSALRILGEDTDLQERLRQDRPLIPNFIEEVLRFESPLRAVSRIARFPTTAAQVPIPAGTTVTLLLGAANRDPSRFDRPSDFDIDRTNARENLAFGRGIHACPGGPLARVEARVALERILDRMAQIRISESLHGPASDRHYEFTKWYLLRGPIRLHLEFTPAS
jgi:cytochrome P450